MKYFQHIITLLIVALSLAVASCSSDSRSSILKVYNWDAYLDLELIPEFEEHYYKETGKHIKVEYDIYEANETLLQKIIEGADYDVICPSGYMVSELIRRNLLQPINHNRIIPLDAYTPWLLGFDYDVHNKYSVPYSYGSTGILYNPTHPNVDREDMKTWAALWDPKYSGRIIMKDNDVETFFAAALYIKRKELVEKSQNFTYPNEYKELLKNVLSDFSADMVGKISQALIQQRSLVKEYMEADGKSSMADGYGDLGLFWSCDAVYAMDRLPTLEYSLPLEGAPIFIDNWAIPVHAKNLDAAYAFLKFVSQPENAKRNIKASGAPIAIYAAAKEYEEELKADTVFFKDKTPEWKAMYIDALFSSDYTMRRCWPQKVDGDYYDVVNTTLKSARAAH